MNRFKSIFLNPTVLLVAGVAFMLAAGFGPLSAQDLPAQQADTTQVAVTPAVNGQEVPATATQESSMGTLAANIKQTMTGYLPRAVGAMAVLVIGWGVAVLVSGGTRRLLKRSGLDAKLAQWTTSEENALQLDMSKGVAKGVFYFVMLFVVVGVFQALQLNALTDPITRLLGSAFEFIPQIIGAALLLLVAWIIASVIRLVVAKVLTAMKLDEKFSQNAGAEVAGKMSLSKAVAGFLYWLVFLLFLPALLSTLGLQGLLEPVQGMLNQILAALPNILAAGLIFFVGWFIARIVSRIVANLLMAVGADRAGEKIGLKTAFGKYSPSQVVGTLVYALIIIPVLISALNALKIEAIARPSMAMLSTIMNVIPAIFAATLVLVVAYIVARFVKGLVTSILAGIGLNNMPVWLGFSKAAIEGERAPAVVVGYVAMVAIMLFAVIEAAQLLGFGILAEMVTSFVGFGSQVILALVVFGIGLYLANLAHRFIVGAGNPGAGLIAQLARIAIVVFVAAMALQQMGIANEIINLAFGILLGAVAVALAIAFGIGSREIAGRQVEKWLSGMKESQ